MNVLATRFPIHSARFPRPRSLGIPPVRAPPPGARPACLSDLYPPKERRAHMRSIKNYIQAVKARREENGDEGFSLIELIVVVVILGVLAAIAIPVFGNIQKQAEKSSVEAAAANAASAVSAALADGDATTTAAAAVTKANAASDKITVSIPSTLTESSKVDTVCVTAVLDSDNTVKKSAGPGC